MTVIEFFDRESNVENIISTLLCAPDKVVFLGNNKKKIERLCERYKEIAQKRGIQVEFEAKAINKNKLMSIVSAVEEVLENNNDCIVDLSGGDDLSLVAVGIVYCDNADKIKLHRFNISNNTMTDCDSDGVLCNSAPLELTIEETVAINGGKIIYSDEKPNGTYRWDFNNEFIDDVYAMWSLCKQNPSLWNSQLSIFDKLLSFCLDSDSLSVYINFADVKDALNRRGEKCDIKTDIYKKLFNLGIINALKIDHESISFSFKNKQTMKCLTKAGQILELIVALKASELKDDSGNPLYTDVMTGVYIDWDSEIHDVDVANEIDVVLMKGLIPIFISCKNGLVKMDELYKLSTVSEKFGGKYVRKVLAVTELEKAGENEAYIKARCDAMGIRILENIDEISEEKFLKELKKLSSTN